MAYAKVSVVTPVTLMYLRHFSVRADARVLIFCFGKSILVYSILFQRYTDMSFWLRTDSILKKVPSNMT